MKLWNINETVCGGSATEALENVSLACWDRRRQQIVAQRGSRQGEMFSRVCFISSRFTSFEGRAQERHDITVYTVENQEDIRVRFLQTLPNAW